MSKITVVYQLIIRFVAVAALAIIISSSTSAQARSTVHAAQSAGSPNFSLPDLSGKERSLRGYSGRPVVLFFFCGCDRCHAAARAWSQIQRAAHAGSMTYVDHASAIIVFSGEADQARQFEKDTMLDPDRTALLLDPDDRVSEGLYDADECPRVFVLNSSQRTVYTNDHADDLPQGIDPSIMIARVVSALAAKLPKVTVKS